MIPADEAGFERRLRAVLDPLDRAPLPVVEGRSDYDLNGGAPPASTTLIEAAVLAPLIRRPDGWRVIFTERAAHLSRHAGQISFPGGRIDPGDAGAADAALREAEEEIGLARSAVNLLGGFGPYRTATGFRVSPFVGIVVDPEFKPQPCAAEVADVFEAPLDFFLDPANHQRHAREWGGATRWFYAMPWGERYVWGATAGMLKALSDRLTLKA